MNQPAESGLSVAAKIGSVWAAVGITSWAEAANFLAFIYTAGMLAHWWWKVFLRDFFVRRGWLLPQKRRKTDVPKP